MYVTVGCSIISKFGADAKTRKRHSYAVLEVRLKKKHKYKCVKIFAIDKGGPYKNTA